MIQVNLLPEVKLQLIRAKRLRRLIILGAIVVTSVAAAIFMLLFLTVNVGQKKALDDLSADINSLSTELQETPDLDRILTVQNQIKTLPGLHAGKPDVTRLAGYLNQITPTEATMSKLTLNYETNIAELDGTADTLTSVNKFVDTLKFTNYRLNPEAENVPAFTNVVLKSFSINQEGSVNFSISYMFDPIIFSASETGLELVVPNIITTRSEVERPRGTFQPEVPAIETPTEEVQP